MRAVCWYGKEDVRGTRVPDPTIVDEGDAIVRVTLTAICGSDLHLYGGFIPTMKKGDVLGHEFMGEVVAVGKAVTSLAIGDRVVVPFTIACGGCLSCKKDLWALCENSNPNNEMLQTLYGSSGSGLFGYSHLYGGFSGGQAEFVRVPFADVGPFKVPEEVSDEQALFLSDIFPTGYMAAENADIHPGAVVAVWGAGPVGLFAMKSARMLGAERIIAIDHVATRLALARQHADAEIIDFLAEDVTERLHDLTGGRGPDACIDAVGLEAHGSGSIGARYDRAKQVAWMATDRLDALRQAIGSCRPGGTVSIPGVYGGYLDKVPMGAAFAKGLTLRMGQTHVHRYLQPLMDRIQTGAIDPSFVISHRLSLDEAPGAYETFRDKQDDCTKVVMRP
ncbi:MAG: glutathione-dependent formaldehyde dehydrogenase [Acidobacteria bacterium]|nr:glutathione-dependent formaldehyde dehydrogenase [Acidobacteriota bacterium]